MTGQQTWLPYCGPAPSPGDWLARWNLDPVLLAVLLLCAAGYSRLFPTAQPAQRMKFGTGWLLLLFLFASPFCALTSALFSARVTHHVLLTVVAAPLMAAAVPRHLRRCGPLAVWAAVQALIFWAWHAPILYSWAMSSNIVYWVMQATLLGSAIGFWLAISLRGPLVAAAALLATMVQMGLLGALITLSASPLYAPHFASTLAWGYAPLEDQQLAGLIMWAPAAGLYLAAALALIGRWLGQQVRLSGAT